MTKEALIVREAALGDHGKMRQDLACIALTRDYFGVDVDEAAIERLQDRDMHATAITALGSECLPTAWDSWWALLHDRLHGNFDGWSPLAAFRALGYARVADLWQDQEAFLRTIQVEKVDPNEDDDLDEFMPDGEGGYYRMHDRGAFEQACAERQAASIAVFKDAGLPSQYVEAEISALFNLEGVSQETFDVYWATRITETQAFARYSPEWPDTSWTGPNDPVGWLTRRHQAALRAHGYEYRFAFWEREQGYDRGSLWIQTDKGPLRLFDSTDAASLRSNFPVRVASIEGKPLFELTRNDVPDWLFDVGRDTWHRKSRLARFWPKLLGKR
ncbi:hypothetical protein [Tropicibacter oceani]|uniref:GNAT family N-acetyltransferase n=1 Tax=Tropicibacter oceani TaxID=3058420 RepID=A0ABY8QKY3_9RHOB|nr:hypothetical protein [Tropicibacter oceani]WGW05199.1 hypothetical protein QF118_06555 [Tropicibacter oceani]